MKLSRLNITANSCLIACMIALTANLFYAEPAWPVDPRADLSLTDIHAIVDANRSMIENLTVTYTYNATVVPEGEVLVHQRETTIVKGDKIVRDMNYGWRQDIDNLKFHRIVGFDGNRSVDYTVHNSQAIVLKSRPQAANRYNSEFFNFNLLNLPHGGDTKNIYSLLDASASTWLSAPGARLREAMEPIGGRQCYVVDLYPNEELKDRKLVSLWLDPERGFVPLRQELWLGKGYPRVIYEVSEVAEIGGQWFAVKGIRSYFGVKDEAATHQHQFDVLEQEDGSFALQINTEVSDDEFDVAKKLPPGTYLLDEVTMLGKTVGGDSK